MKTDIKEVRESFKSNFAFIEGLIGTENAIYIDKLLTKKFDKDKLKEVKK